MELYLGEDVKLIKKEPMESPEHSSYAPHAAPFAEDDLYEEKYECKPKMEIKKEELFDKEGQVNVTQPSCNQGESILPDYSNSDFLENNDDCFEEKYNCIPKVQHVKENVDLSSCDKEGQFSVAASCNKEENISPDYSSRDFFEDKGTTISERSQLLEDENRKSFDVRKDFVNGVPTNRCNSETSITSFEQVWVCPIICCQVVKTEIYDHSGNFTKAKRPLEKLICGTKSKKYPNENDKSYKSLKDCSADIVNENQQEDIGETFEHQTFCMPCIPSNRTEVNRGTKNQKASIKSGCKRYLKFSCKLCCKSYDSYSKLKLHQKAKCGELNLFSCNVCAKGYSAQTTLDEHIRINHSSEGTSLHNHKCTFCGQNLSSKHALEIHIYRMHNDNRVKEPPQICNICYKTLSSKSTLGSHMQSVHNKGNHSVECGHCGKSYSCKRSLVPHIFSAHMERSLKCSDCKLEFKTEYGLKSHKLSKHWNVDEGIMCEVCAKVFKTNGKLKIHLASHGDEKLHICEKCGKGFKRRANLDQHMKTHSDHRPFICEICKKGFRIKHHLQQHMSVHGMVHASTVGKRKCQ